MIGIDVDNANADLRNITRDGKCCATERCSRAEQIELKSKHLNYNNMLTT